VAIANYVPCTGTPGCHCERLNAKAHLGIAANEAMTKLKGICIACGRDGKDDEVESNCCIIGDCPHTVGLSYRDVDLCMILVLEDSKILIDRCIG